MSISSIFTPILYSPGHMPNFEAQGSVIASEAIERIEQLYKIEKQVRGSPPDKRVD